ncbi:hypothetical protein R9X47_22685 [Wukongibacter baidiensis]|uniref:hypothetical protein n=1 Tax=Wukongibacter baidiensis TaxID=1723361 RepID=UPI003D7F34A9
MVDYMQQYKEFEKQFGKLDSEELINQIQSFIVNHELDLQTKSKFLSLIGGIICDLSTYLKDDCGYSYFREAIEVDANNYDAILGVCSIFNTYPYPFNKIVTEVEYLSHVEKLINDFELLENNQKLNALQTIKSYSIFRKKIIECQGDGVIDNDGEVKIR